MINKIKALLNHGVAKVKKAFESTKENHISPIDTAMYRFFKKTRLHIIIPSVSIVIMLYLIKLYLANILLLILGIVILIKWFTSSDEEAVEHIDRYIYMRDILYQSFDGINTILPIRSPQTVIDIVHIPEFINEGRYAVYLYQLTKTTYEHAEQSMLDFAQKILQANIDKQLNQYEHIHADGTTFYNDLRLITLTNIVDMGTHYRLEIIWVDDEKTYSVARKQLTKKETINNADTKDEDF